MRREGSSPVLCSTPFGITVVGTRQPCRPWAEGTSRCAQRLSASLWSARPEMINSCVRLDGAQRLSASLWSAHPGTRCRSDAGFVLNAFRHHCGRHFLRHGHQPACQLCSTPFGITVVGTLTIPFIFMACCVLNAFRHHCGRHILAVRRLGLDVRCSTPFGITVVGTLRLRLRLREQSRAQRLSASLWSARRARPRSRRKPIVLNAFRHHCGRHGFYVDRASRHGAQRLSASLWSARS